MSEKLRALITGFGPFPGAPFNPSERLVKRLCALRRPAFADIERIPHIFTVTYGDVDRDLPRLIADHRPHILLMFGLAARTPFVRIETRARNAITTIWPDADGTRIGLGRIARGADDALMFGPHTARLLRAAVGTGTPTQASRDAGRYLCNYLCWRTIEANATSATPPLSAFVHVPLVPRGTVSNLKGRTRKVTSDDLLRSGEAILREIVKMARLRDAPAN